MAFWNVMGHSGTSGSGATITILYSSEFYGQTIIATNGVETVTKVAPSTGYTDIEVPEGGTWTISSTISGQTYSTTVTVNLEYTATLEGMPTGETALPTDDIGTWLRCAQIKDKAYTTLSQVLNDMATFEALVSDSNACDYMVRSTSWASDVCADADAMAYIGKYDYCANKLLSNATWAEAICNSTYIDSVLNTKVPTMTSNTAPSGTASASVGNANAYKAFDGNTSTYWDENYSTNQWIAYEYASPVIVNAVSILSTIAGSTYRRIQNFKVEGYKDGEWETIYTGVYQKTSEATPQKFSFTNSTAYTKYRLYVVDTYDGTYIGITELQFYGRTDTMIPLVPRMTSNTTPSGEAFCSNEQSGKEAYRSFDGIISSSDYTIITPDGNSQNREGYIGYKSANAKVINSIMLHPRIYTYTALSVTLKIQGSNDGFVSDIHDLYTDSSFMPSDSPTYISFSNNTAYTGYRVWFDKCLADYGSGYCSYIYALQFYIGVNKATQTLFHSAAQDDIYYIDNGSPVIIAHTDDYGYAVVDRDLLPEDEYLTLYSTVAKDPDNLGNAYSKTVHFSKYLTEVRVMPLKEIYWFGYDKNAEDCISANGWSYGISNYTLAAPTHNTNCINFETSASNVGKAYGSKKTMTGTANAIIEAVNVYQSESVAFFENTTKVVKNNWTGATYGITNTSPTKYSRNIANSYPYVEVYGTGRSANLYALWVE